MNILTEEEKKWEKGRTRKAKDKDKKMKEKD